MEVQFDAQGASVSSDLDDVRLLTPPNAARVLAISERSLWSLTKTRELPAIKIGRSVRYRLADLRAFVARRLEENS